MSRSLAGPIPRTPKRSACTRKGPFLRRNSTIRLARTGPTPLRRSSSEASARFRSIRCVATEPNARVGPRFRGAGTVLSRVSRSARRSSVAGPTPFTRVRSSRDAKAPAASRSATMRPANAGPMPGRRASSTASAALGSIRSPGSRARVRRASAAAATLEAVSRESKTDGDPNGVSESGAPAARRTIDATASSAPPLHRTLSSRSCTPQGVPAGWAQP